MLLISLERRNEGRREIGGSGEARYDERGEKGEDRQGNKKFWREEKY